MKRLICLLLTVCTLLLIGCAKTVPPKENPNSAFGYTEADLTEIVLKDKTRDIVVDMSANDRLRNILLGLSYNPDEKNDGAARVKYELTISGKTMLVYEGHEVVYDGGDKYPVAPALLSYLDALFVGEAHLLEPSVGENVKVYNSKNQVAEVSDIPAFLEGLNGLSVIRLSEVTDFTLETADYRIETGHDTISIYGDIIVIGSTAYAVVEGDFDFLKGLKYSSSSDGFLPWI